MRCVLTRTVSALCCLARSAFAFRRSQMVTGLQQAVLLNDPSTPQFAKWIDNSAAPLMLTAYVYDIRNEEEVLRGAKPIIVENGPYVYKVSEAA
jgi:hypothetical protein